MNARYYLPGIGRFLSADTLVPNPSDPQSFNCYTYVLNNPLKFTDPSGHISCTNSNLPGDDQQACLDTQLPPPIREPIDAEAWEIQILTLVTYVEMHGHGNAHAEAITWVLLNRISGMKSLRGGSFNPNPNFSGESMVAAYSMSWNQTALGHFLMDDSGYKLLELGNGANFIPAKGWTLREVVDEAFTRLSNHDPNVMRETYYAVVGAMNDYNSGRVDPTYGAV